MRRLFATSTRCEVSENRWHHFFLRPSTCFTHRFFLFGWPNLWESQLTIDLFFWSVFLFFCDLSLKNKNLTWLFHLATTEDCLLLKSFRGPAAANHWPWPSSSCYEETENYKRCGENSWKPRRSSRGWLAKKPWVLRWVPWVKCGRFPPVFRSGSGATVPNLLLRNR